MICVEKANCQTDSEAAYILVRKIPYIYIYILDILVSLTLILCNIRENLSENPFFYID